MLKRIWIYLLEMYPPFKSLAWCAFTVAGMHFLVSLLSGNSVLLITPQSLIGILTLFLFLMFMRVSDEFKDAEIDRLLFSHRPLPSGRVLESDLKVLGGVAVSSMLGLNVFGRGLFTFDIGKIMFFVLLSYGFLMLKYFFVPQKISKSLILALVTHNPSVILMNLYVLSLFCSREKSPLFLAQNLLVVALFWLPGLAWELSRKIKAPIDENQYETYSRIFGFRLAALLPLIVLSLNSLILLYFSAQLDFDWFYRASVIGQVLIFAFFVFRFIFNPNTKTSQLKPITEACMLINTISLVTEMVFHFPVGFQWTL
jgi:4-hydroxybenzoate polyprenyltransferase